VVYGVLSTTTTLPNLTWEDCGEAYTDIYSSGELSLTNFTFEIHSELGDKIGCYLNVGINGLDSAVNGLKESLDNIANKIQTQINVTINGITDAVTGLPGRIWDNIVNGLESYLHGYLGIGWSDVASFFQWLIAVIFMVLGLILGLILLYPVICGLTTVFIQGVFIIIAYAQSKREGGNKQELAWKFLTYLFTYNIRWFGSIIAFSLSILVIPLDIGCDTVKSAWFGGKWDWVSKPLFNLSLRCLTGRF
jgi:hypothetical protein